MVEAGPRPRSQHERLVELAPCVALVGNPNCGKTALFNALTGSRRSGQLPGRHVEKKTGRLTTPGGPRDPGPRPARHLFPAGAQPDEEITRDSVLGKLAARPLPT